MYKKRPVMARPRPKKVTAEAGVAKKTMAVRITKRRFTTLATE